jgi:hypothetical protein
LVLLADEHPDHDLRYARENELINEDKDQEGEP